MALPVTPQEALDAFVKMLDATPIGVRGVAGVAAALLIVAGARFYRMAIVLPGILAGVFEASALPLSVEPGWRLGVGVVVSAMGGLILFFMEKLAVYVVGAMLGGWVTWVLWPIVAQIQGPWWALAVGALAGMVAFPAIFPTAIRWVTSITGALLGAWALGHPGNPWIIMSLAAVGIVVQTLTQPASTDDEVTG